MIDLFYKEYDGDSLYDLQRDVLEAISDDFNPSLSLKFHKMNMVFRKELLKFLLSGRMMMKNKLLEKI